MMSSAQVAAAPTSAEPAPAAPAPAVATASAAPASSDTAASHAARIADRDAFMAEAASRAQAVADKRDAEAAAIRDAEQARRDEQARVVGEQRRREHEEAEAEQAEIAEQEAALAAEQDAAARAAWASEMVARAAAASVVDAKTKPAAAPAQIFTRIRPGVLSPILGSSSSLANNRRAAALVHAQSIVVPRSSPSKTKSLAKSQSAATLEGKERGGKQAKPQQLSSPAAPDPFANRAPFDHSSPYTGALRPGFLLQPLPAPPQFGQTSVTLEATLARQGATGYVVAASMMSSSMAGPRVGGPGGAKHGSGHSPTRAPNGVETAPSAVPGSSAGGPGAGSDSGVPVIPPFVFESRELLMGSLVERAARLAEIQRAKEEAKDGETVSGASMWDDIPTDRDRKRQAERAASILAQQRKDASPPRGQAPRAHSSHGRDNSNPHRRGGSVAPMDQIAAVHAATLETIVGAAREAQAIAVMQAQAEAEAKALQRHQEREARHARTRSSYINTKELRSRHAHARSNSSHHSNGGQQQRSPSSKDAQMSRTQVFVTPPPEFEDSASPAAATRSPTAAWPQQQQSAAAEEEEKQQEPNVATRLDFNSPPEAVPTIESMLHPASPKGSSNQAATNEPAATPAATDAVVVGGEVAESGRIRSRRGSLEGTAGGSSAPLEIESQSQLIITHDRPPSAAALKERRPSRVGAAVAIPNSHHDAVDHTAAASSEGATSPSAEAGSSELYHVDTPRGSRKLAAVSPESDVRAMEADAAAGNSNSGSSSKGKKKSMAWGQDEIASPSGSSGSGSKRKAVSARSSTSPLSALPEGSAASSTSPSAQPRASTLHPRFQRVSRAHPTAGCFPPVPIALPIADPAAGPTMSEYMQSLALVAKPRRPTQAVVSTVVPLPQEFARIKGAGLLTLGSAVAYGSSLTPEILALRRRQKVRRERERAAAIAWFEEKYVAEQERRKQWAQGDVHQTQEQLAERAAEDEQRRKLIEQEHAARDAQRQVERALYAARLEPLLALCALLLSPASRLLEQAPAIYLSRVWDQKEHCTWFPLLFQWAEHDLGRTAAETIDLLTLLVQSDSDKADSFLLTFFDRSYEKVCALPPRTRVQLAAKFVATWGKGPFTAAGEPEPWALPGNTVPTPLTPRSRERMDLMLASAEAKLAQRRAHRKPVADSSTAAGSSPNGAAAGDDQEESAAVRAVRKEKAAAEKARIKADRTAALKSALAAEREAAYAAMVAEREAAYGISPAASKAARRNKRRSTGLSSSMEGVPGPRRAEDEALDAEVAEKVALIAAEMAKRHAEAQAKLSMIRAPDHASKQKLALICSPSAMLLSPDDAAQFGAPKPPKPKPTSAAARNAEEFAAEAKAAKAASDERAARIAAAKKAEAEAKRTAKLEAAAAVAAQVALEKKQFAAALEKKRAEEAAVAEAAAIRKAEREALAEAARQKAEEEAIAAAAKRRQLKEERARAKQQREEEAAAALALRREEQAAAAAAAQQRADEEAAEAAARKAAREEAAAAKKRAEEEIAAKKRDEMAAAAALAKAKRDAEAAAAAKQLADSIAAAEAAVALAKLSKEEQAKHKAAAAAAKEQAAAAAAAEAAAKRIEDQRAAEAAETKKREDARAAAAAAAAQKSEQEAAAKAKAQADADAAAKPKADSDATAKAKSDADAAAKAKADAEAAQSAAPTAPAATPTSAAAPAAAVSTPAAVAAPVIAPASAPAPAPASSASSQPTPADDFPAGAALRLQVLSLMEQERFAEALPLAEQELEEREAFYAASSAGSRGAHDPALLPSLDHCATLHEIQGSPAAALPYLFQALQCEKAAAGTLVHLSVAAALQRMGEALMALHEGEDAFNVYARCYLIRRALLGPAHEMTVKAREGVMFLTEAGFEIDKLSLEEIPPLEGEEGDGDAEEEHASKLPKPRERDILLASPPAAAAEDQAQRR